MRHPIQPIGPDSDGTMRFLRNAIVWRLLNDGPFDMNVIAEWDVPREDREQFAQLIGYSLAGFSELSYVRDETYNAAAAMAGGADEAAARIAALEEILERVRAGLRVAAPAVFSIHPDDLGGT